MTIPSIKIPANKVVIIQRNHGGYLIGECIACDALGWLKGNFGQPAHSNSGIASELIHKEECPMNDILDDEGDIIED